MPTFLPPELVEQIICKLPTKSLFRFSAVSKDWHKFITPSVKKLSCRNLFLFGCSSRNEFALYLHSNGIWEEYARHKAPLQEEELRITGCGNGFILFSDGEQVILWNPLFNRCLTLPELGQESRLDEINCAFGIVVGQSKNDIKILRYDISSTVEIFRMSSGEWKFLNHQAPFYSHLSGCQVDLKGISYWIGHNSVGKMLLVSFDGHTELFRSVELPLPRLSDNKVFFGEWYGNQVLFSFDESLVFIHGEHYAGDNEKYVISCQIWKMADSEGKDWDLCWTFLFKELVRPLGFREDGEFMWAGCKTKKLISTNLKNGSRKRLGAYCAKRIFSYPNYDESLALLDA